MKYVIVNPFPLSRGNGITSYIKNMLPVLEAKGIEAVCVSNDTHTPRVEFQNHVATTIPDRFDPGEVVIEAPEVGASTLLLPRTYPLHIRLHCPNAIVQKNNNEAINQPQLEDELSVIRGADVVSSPSYALLDELAEHLDGVHPHVFKNPPSSASRCSSPSEKKHDVIFLGKFVPLKGIDYLNELLALLPSDYSVVLVGRGASSFELGPNIGCHVEVYDHIDGPRRLRLLGGARVCLMLSRFENCSMVVIESLGVGTVVVGWDTGGHAEIAPPPLIQLVEHGDLPALIARINQVRDANYPGAEEFNHATTVLRHDFERGWQHVWERFEQTTDVEIFRGLNCRRAHRALSDN